MSNLGFQMVYHLFNQVDWCVCERAFLPAKDEIEEFIRTSTELFSYESQTPLKEFDIIAFSIPFEEDYTNIPVILALSRIPVLSGDRADLSPLVLSGGVAVSLNPEPLALLMDLFLIGEGEGMAQGFLEEFRRTRERASSKGEVLRGLDALEWAYLPGFYRYEYEGAVIKGVERERGAKRSVKAAKRFDLDCFPVPESFIRTPDTEFRDTFLIEVERGCPMGCRFCAAGFLYLPPRWREYGAVKASVKRGMESTGKVGLVGTAVSEYPRIKDALAYGIESEGAMTLSSLRLDRLDDEFIGLLKQGGYKTVTLAPEAGTERMRAVVNKGMTDVDILDSIRLISEAGFSKIKLYFLIGLPSETDEDALGIADLVKRIKATMKRGEITLSVNPFIPKPCTPFQWHGFERPETIDRRLDIIKKGVSKEHGVTVKALSSREAFIQAYISRADRRAGGLIIDASKRGWKRAAAGADFIEDSVYAKRDSGSILPWDIIDHGIRKSYLWKEYRKGLKGGLTPACDVGRCFRCGVCAPGLFH
ncbi:MAG: radical SAM protein [Deltaproteobacteria bacterium]